MIAATLKAGDATERRINYEYDAAGNRTKEEAVVGTLPQTTDYEALEFDAVNRVTAVVKGTRRSEFFYDGMGRRVRMVEREGATVASDKRYIWDGGEIVEERDGQNTGGVTKRYFGAGVQEVAANAPTNLFYSRDHLGSVREVTDANGNLVARYDYDAWGRRTRVFGTYEADWGYAGYFLHHPSKLNLTWFRAYDPDLGRWVSRDPIAEQGGLNLYGYVGNNPIGFLDPFGLFDCVVVGAAIGGGVGGLIGGTVGGVAGLVGIVGGPAVLATSGAGALAGASYGAGAGVIGGAIIGGLLCSNRAPEKASDQSGDRPKEQEKCPQPRSPKDPCKELRKRLAEHIKKLADYLANPDSYDNKGYLQQNPHLRDQIINGRKRHLNHEIETFRRQLEECERRHGLR